MYLDSSRVALSNSTDGSCLTWREGEGRGERREEGRGERRGAEGRGEVGRGGGSEEHTC